MMRTSKIAQIIVISTIIRCVIACTIGLGNDEVYYTEYAQHLQWNYFDHPPMVALLIKITTINLLFFHDFFIRLGPILLSAITTFLIYKITKKVKDEKAGIIAALLFSASIYSSIIAGIFIMPDAPQLFFWISCVYILFKIISSERFVNLNLLLFGILSGLCIMSKIHGVFLWVGFGLYIVLYCKKLLFNPYLYLSIVLTLCIISPILLWNIDNNFITYTFHSNRVTINNGFNINSFIREIFGGLLYNNPLNYLLIVTTLFLVIKNKLALKNPNNKLLILLSLPLIIVLIFIAMFRDTLPHWSGPAFTTLLIFVAINYSLVSNQLLKFVNYSLYLLLFISVLGVLVINFYPGTLGKKDSLTLGKGDVTLDMYDWNFFKNEFKTYYNSVNFKNKSKPLFIINNKWFPASHIDKYIAQPLGLNFVAKGKLEDIHTFQWLNTYRKPLQEGNDAFFITFSNYYTNPNEVYNSNFDSIQLTKTIVQYRSGKPVRKMYVYLLKKYKVSN